MSRFSDGIRSLVSALINRRDPVEQNYISSRRLSQETLRTIYKTGIANKIVRLKTGFALKNTIQFESVDDEDFYNKRLAKIIKKATRWMIASGRGAVVIHHRGDDLRSPLGEVDLNRVRINVFGGDMVTCSDVDLDLQSDNYLKPRFYNVRGTMIHYSRVVDFTYIEPPELDAPIYNYGGISEFELIYDQLIADGVVQRASPKILEKASTIFYKVTGFREAVMDKREQDMIDYFSRLEDVRGIHSAGLIDKDDEVQVIDQAISNLAEADQITLRRLAMVTGIPLTELIGEAAKGLNSSGENERRTLQDMIEALQSDYLLDPVNQVMAKLDKGAIKFKENQGETAGERIDYETKAIANAMNLYSMGEDYRYYLEEKGVLKKDDFAEMFDDEA